MEEFSTICLHKTVWPAPFQHMRSSQSSRLKAVSLSKKLLKKCANLNRREIFRGWRLKVWKSPTKMLNCTFTALMATDGGLKGNRRFMTSLRVVNGHVQVQFRVAKMVYHKEAAEKCSLSSVEKASLNSEMLLQNKVRSNDRWISVQTWNLNASFQFMLNRTDLPNFYPYTFCFLNKILFDKVMM